MIELQQWRRAQRNLLDPGPERVNGINLLAVPVVDAAGHMLGIVTVDDVIDAILQESSEDVQKFGGMTAIGQPYLQIGFGQMIWSARAGSAPFSSAKC